MVELLRQDGIETVVPLWRQDAGNPGLHDAVERLFTEAGGTVTAGASYPPGTTDFSTPLAAIRSEIEAAVAQGGAATVAVYFAAFEESAVGIFAAASADPVFSQVRWYGGDGMVQSALVLADPDRRRLRRRDGASGADVRPGRSAAPAECRPDRRHRGQERSHGRRVQLAAYDALHVATLAYAEVGLGSIEEYRSELLSQAGAYTGATGPTELNAAGDRAVGDYDFYQVCAGTPPSWSRVAAYRAAAGNVVSVGEC